MAHIKITSHTPPTISIPTWFITDYMPKANGGYVKVYLLLIATYSQGNSIDLEEVAGKLDMLHSEVIAALDFWDKQSIITFNKLEDETFELIFHTSTPKATSSGSTDTPAPKQTNQTHKPLITQTRPNYSSEELSIYKSQESITRLFLIAEEYLGRLLSPSDQQTLFGFYDWLHMPIDLIEYLLEYCVSNNHTNMRYIEKVAISWIDSGINTVEAAKSKILSDSSYYKILNELGISSQHLTSVQKDFINKWLNTYKLSLEVVLEGCRRAVAQTKNPSLKYVDAMLSSWYHSKVSSIQDIEKIDKAYQSNNQKQTFTANKRPAKSKNERFTNILSHERDFELLEQLEEEYIERKLSGGNQYDK